MRIVIAISVWAFGIAGAFGVARWLELNHQETALLVGAVAIVVVFGALLPVLKLNQKS
jgi:drug/metabolite transporter superfamily protein YnfA